MRAMRSFISKKKKRIIQQRSIRISKIYEFWLCRDHYMRVLRPKRRRSMVAATLLYNNIKKSVKFSNAAVTITLSVPNIQFLVMKKALLRVVLRDTLHTGEWVIYQCSWCNLCLP